MMIFHIKTYEIFQFFIAFFSVAIGDQLWPLRHRQLFEKSSQWQQ